MINIAGINKNDVINGEGVSVSLFLQGCPFHCEGCHNPETWDLNGGFAHNEWWIKKQILTAINANGIVRNLSILGGEPLDRPEKIIFIKDLIREVRKDFPNIKIFIWSGFTYEELKKRRNLKYVLEHIDVLIDGPFKIAERDITLPLRGSRNQRVIDMKSTLETGEVKLYKA